METSSVDYAFIDELPENAPEIRVSEMIEQSGNTDMFSFSVRYLFANIDNKIWKGNHYEKI